MYDELVKRLREVAEEVCEDYDVDPYNAEQRFFVIAKAADAIEKLAAFKAQITDGRFYVYKFGTLFELKHDPRDLTVEFQYPEPPKEE